MYTRGYDKVETYLAFLGGTRRGRFDGFDLARCGCPLPRTAAIRSRWHSCELGHNDCYLQLVSFSDIVEGRYG